MKKQLRSETSVERACCKHAMSLGIPSLKLVKMLGIPDRVFLVATSDGPDTGKIIFVEFKKEGEEPRAIQEIRIAWLRKLGFITWVIDTVPEFKKLLKEYLDG